MFQVIKTSAENATTSAMATSSTETTSFVDTYSATSLLGEEGRMVLIVVVGAIFAIITSVGNLMVRILHFPGPRTEFYEDYKTINWVEKQGTSCFQVMVSFKIDKQLQTISNYFLFSLAVADIAIGISHTGFQYRIPFVQASYQYPCSPTTPPFKVGTLATQCASSGCVSTTWWAMLPFWICCSSRSIVTSQSPDPSRIVPGEQRKRRWQWSHAPTSSLWSFGRHGSSPGRTSRESSLQNRELVSFSFCKPIHTSLLEPQWLHSIFRSQSCAFCTRGFTGKRRKGRKSSESCRRPR